MKYDGWNWDPAIREWVETDVGEVEVEVQIPAYPKPDEPPRPAQPLDVPGWYWNGRAGVWEEIPLTPQEISEDVERGSMPEYVPGPAEPTKAEGWTWSIEFKLWVADTFETAKAIFTPPRSLPPNVTQAMVEGIYPYADISRKATEMFVGMGMSQHDAHQLGVTVIERLRNMMTAATRGAQAARWQGATRSLAVQMGDKFEVIGVYGAIFIITTVTGLLIGNILSRLLTPDTDYFILVAPPNTYLLGPDWWLYSRHIGTSLGGRPFYSECEIIGTEYTRHKRGRWSGEPDTIDFLGGFLETGFQFPYWVKYLWSYWLVEYIGVLESAGPNFHKLKKPIYDPAARLPIGWSAPVSEWCQDFHYYL